jgi:hypothetical protein
VFSNSFRNVLFLGVVAVVFLLEACISTPTITPTPIQISPTPVPTATEPVTSPTPTTDVLYEQPLDLHGKLLLSAWRDPDGSDYDEYVWDDFTLSADGTISEISWYGVYDPMIFGKGGRWLIFG